ncbi:hypothetical protein [Clostridium folliculivorans]|uniref:Uncharacterized protein n=1 Tax=Clostridium folliculivorans TaxID=2886038 RepID=A0A9W6D989_9CLOT|nr:hypothetical protein [Clostridium folliculivorans]GKU24060.1 hypothetical protein CFOLD11_08860 [Clostridium folliculivorans]GKU30173.1 hypothetical protein CFB3_22800 [Clostridium folliculivorans]
MVNNSLLINSEEGQSLDKLQIALAIKNSTYGQELSCSLLENEVIKDCEGCSLKYICQKLNELVEDYTAKTTKVISSFSFEE